MAYIFRNWTFFFLLFCTLISSAQNEISNRKVSFSAKDAVESYEAIQIKNLYASYNKGDEKTAYNTAHQLLKNAKLAKTITNANLLIAYYFNKQSSLDSALYYTKKVLQKSLPPGDSINNRKITLCYNLMASIYRRKGLLSESKKYRIKGMESALKFNEQELYYNHKHGLALIYSQEGDNNKALQLFKECLTYKKDPEMIYGSYINIGDIYSELKNYDLSNQYLKKAELLCEKNQDFNGRAVVANSIGANYFDQNQFENALKYYKVALEIAEAHNYQQTVLDTRISIAKIYYNQKKYEDAKILFTAALINAKQLKVVNEQLTIYETLKDIALIQNNYKDAFFIATRNEELKDSVNSIQNKKDISEMEIKFNTLQKEKRIKALQFENETSQLILQNQDEAIKNLNLQKEIEKNRTENTLLFFQNSTEKKLGEIALLKKQKQLKSLEIEQEKETRNIIITSFSFLFILALGLLFQYYKRLRAERILNKKQKEINTQKLESILKEQELKLIKASIEGQDKERQRIAQELHDSIGGNLAAIKLQVNTMSEDSNDGFAKNIISQLDETYQQVRNLSHNLIPKKFSQNQFCLVLEDYLKSINGATELKIESNFYPKETINQLNENLQVEVFTIVQELLTNTIKHAKATQIDLQLNLIENYLNIIFEDNGIGFNSTDTPKGIGLQNIENRVKNLFGTIEIDSKIKRGTIANIEVPILEIKDKIDFNKQFEKLTQNL